MYFILTWSSCIKYRRDGPDIFIWVNGLTKNFTAPRNLSCLDSCFLGICSTHQTALIYWGILCFLPFGERLLEYNYTLLFCQVHNICIMLPWPAKDKSLHELSHLCNRALPMQMKWTPAVHPMGGGHLLLLMTTTAIQRAKVLLRMNASCPDMQRNGVMHL